MEQAAVLSTIFWVVGIIMAAATLAAGLGNAFLTSRMIEGVSRQPEAAGILFTRTLISAGLVESMAIISTVVALILLFANPLL